MNMYRVDMSDAFIASPFDIALSYASVQETLAAAVKACRVEHLTLNVEQPSSIMPYSWSTLPAEWITRYLRQSYVKTDPILRAGFSRNRPFFWSVCASQPELRSFVEEASRHGAGQCGYSIPIIMHNQPRGLLTASSVTMEPPDWRYYIQAIEQELRDFAVSIYSRALTEIHSGDKPAPDELFAGGLLPPTETWGSPHA